MRGLVMVGAILVTASLAVAAEASAQPACKQIADSLKRLACYDSSATAETPPKPKGTAVENWIVSEKTNPLTDAKEAVAILESEDKGRLGRSPALVIRCSGGDVNAYINWANYLADNATVTYRFDKNAPAVTRWSASSDKTATFYPKNERAFADSLTMFSSFVASITPYQEGPTVATFQLAGAKSAVATVMEACPEKVKK